MLTKNHWLELIAHFTMTPMDEKIKNDIIRDKKSQKSKRFLKKQFLIRSHVHRVFSVMNAHK